ncbi:MAG: ABC transporter permease [Angelakisella sp.]|nr:ABC transporter permease [Angelakisella sp.]
MTTVMNFRNKRGWEGAPLLRQLARRNLPWMGLFFALTFLALPLQYMLAIFYWPVELYDSTVYSGNPPSMPAWAPNYTPSRIFTKLSLIQFGILVTAGAILIALWQTQWLQSKRQGEFWYSLPVKRENLLLAHAGAAWLTIALPLAADYLVVLLAGAARLAQSAGTEGDGFVFPVGEILLDLFGWLVTALAVIAIIFLVAVMTGGFFKTLILSGALMGALPMAAAFLDLAIQQFIVGWSGASIMQHILSFSPVFVMPNRYGSYNTFWGTYPALANWMLLVWLAIGLFCLWLACRVFRDRLVEMAGTGAVREPLGLVVTFLATLAGGLALGLLFWSSIYPRPSFLLTVVLCSLGAAVLCQVILKWDLKTLRKSPDLRGLGKVLPFLALCMVLPVTAAYIVTHGGLGYEDYIPPVGEVQEVRVRYRGRYGTLAKRLDHQDESVHPAETGENWYSLDGSELPADLWKTWYSYNDYQYVYLTTPEGIQAAEALHRSLLEWQKGAGEGQQGIMGSIDFLYNDEMRRHYGQWRKDGNQVYDSERDLTALLALEEDPEFRRQTDPRFTVTADEIRAIRVSDDVGLTTSSPITDRGTIERLLAAMKADAETFDYSTLREGTARAAAYLTVETISPTPWYKISGDQPGETTSRVSQDLWRDFCLPVYREDQNTLDALWASGLGEYTGQSLSKGKVTGLQINWWGAASWNEEAYWTGIGPRDLWPGNEAWPQGEEPRESAAALLVTDPQQMEELLALCRGNDCHVSEQGFTVTILGGDRTGSTFWLAAQKDAPQFLRDWYLENERTLRSSWGQRFQYLP